MSFADALAAEPARMANGTHVERSDFSYFSRGLYHQQVSRYLEHFPISQMLFLLSEDLQRRPAATLETVYRFLGVADRPYEPITEDEAHQAYMPVSLAFQGLLEPASRLKRLGKRMLPAAVRKPMMSLMWRIQERNRKPFKASPMHSQLRAELRDRYADDRATLTQLIGRDLSFWSR